LVAIFVVGNRRATLFLIEKYVYKTVTHINCGEMPRKQAALGRALHYDFVHTGRRHPYFQFMRDIEDLNVLGIDSSTPSCIHGRLNTWCLPQGGAQDPAPLEARWEIDTVGATP
jgi:hypothetical protein